MNHTATTTTAYASHESIVDVEKQSQCKDSDSSLPSARRRELLGDEAKQPHPAQEQQEKDADADADDADAPACAPIEPVPSYVNMATPSPRLQWTQCALAHLVIFNAWGFSQSFGVFQAYFTTLFGAAHPPSSISWIGSLQVLLLFGTGIVSGRALDAGLFRPTYAVGLALQTVGIFCMSIEPVRFVHVLLSCGIALGLGSGLVFPPTIGLIATYFADGRNRALAIALVSSGTATGGLVYPAVVRCLLPQIGYGWTVRVCGFILVSVGVFAGCFLRPRRDLAPRRTGGLVEWRALREPAYLVFCVGMFVSLLGFWFAFYYIASYARDVVGLTEQQGFELLMTMNGAGGLSRVPAALLADRVAGPLSTFVVVMSMCCVLLYAWAGVHTEAGIWAWCVVYGLVGAMTTGLFPAVLSSFTQDPRKQGVMIGLGFAVAGVASAAGPPIAGAIVQGMGGRYIGAQMYAASMLLVGVLLMFVVRWLRVGFRFVKV